MYILVFWKNVILKVAVIVAANSRNAIKHFRKSAITDNQSAIHINYCYLSKYNKHRTKSNTQSYRPFDKSRQKSQLRR